MMSCVLILGIVFLFQGTQETTLIFFSLDGFRGQPQGSNFPPPRATMLALHLDCSTAALTAPQKIWRLVELKILQWSHDNWYFHLDISRWPMSTHKRCFNVRYTISGYSILKIWIKILETTLLYTTEKNLPRTKSSTGCYAELLMG